jgi:hypothetical protein
LRTSCTATFLLQVRPVRNRDAAVDKPRVEITPRANPIIGAMYLFPCFLCITSCYHRRVIDPDHSSILPLEHATDFLLRNTTSVCSVAAFLSFELSPVSGCSQRAGRVGQRERERSGASVSGCGYSRLIRLHCRILMPLCAVSSA